MSKWKAVRVKQKLVKEVERELAKGEYPSFSDFVSEAIQQRLQTLAKQRVSEYLERDKAIRASKLQAQAFYSPRHIWAQQTPQKTVTIGVTRHFQEQLREIVNVKTDGIGEKISRDEPFGVAESWWFTYDLHSPLNGRIVAVNKTVIEDPFTLNVDPSTWIVEIQPDPSEADLWMKNMLEMHEYQEFVTKRKILNT